MTLIRVPRLTHRELINWAILLFLVSTVVYAIVRPCCPPIEHSGVFDDHLVEGTFEEHGASDGTDDEPERVDRTL